MSKTYIWSNIHHIIHSLTYHHKTTNPKPHNQPNLIKKVRIITIARGSQNIVSHNMSNGTPCKNINNIKPDRIIRLQKTNILLSPCIPSLKMSDTILLR
ncbi:hypothetical protein Hanom_Chr05g00469831 [Helianthus anomalus]